MKLDRKRKLVLQNINFVFRVKLRNSVNSVSTTRDIRKPSLFIKPFQIAADASIMLPADVLLPPFVQPKAAIMPRICYAHFISSAAHFIIRQLSCRCVSWGPIYNIVKKTNKILHSNFISGVPKTRRLNCWFFGPLRTIFPIVECGLVQYRGIFHSRCFLPRFFRFKTCCYPWNMTCYTRHVSKLSNKDKNPIFEV